MEKSKAFRLKGRGWLSVVVTALAIFLIITTLIPLISTNWWLIRVFAFPQAQLTALLMIAGIAALLVLNLGKSWPKLLLASIVAAIIYQLQYLLSYTPLAATQIAAAEECPAGHRVRILTFNVLHSNSRYDATIDLVRRTRPDLFLAMETDLEWARALQQLRSEMPNIVAEPRAGPWGMMLFSRLPLKNAQVSRLVEGYVPSIRAWVELPSGTGFTFHGVHPKPPLMHSSETGDRELMMVGRKVRQSAEPAVVAGDLNDVPWSATTQRFLQVSGMSDPRVGRAFDATFWLAPLIGWPLDHVYASRDFRLIRFDPGSDVGSDHLPLLAELCLAPVTRQASGVAAVEAR